MKTIEPIGEWSTTTMRIINKLTPDIKEKAFDPDWFLLRERFEAVDRALRSLAEMSQWISVKDRLPDVGFHVLIYGSWQTQTVGYLRASVSHGIETNGRYWHVAHNTQKGCNWPFEGVTHWMPLPKPPAA